MSKITWDIEPFNAELEEFILAKAEIIAKQIARDAKSSTAFKDKTGRLRKSIRAKKSKFDDGGWIARAGGKNAMQSWLVEHGHGPGKLGRGTTAPPKAYLEPARVQNIEFAKREFGAK
jgi:hypothetical protein